MMFSIRYPYERQLLIWLARQSRNFVDVGAFYGWYSGCVLSANPNISVVAFEPNLDSYKVLRKAIGSKATIFRMVVGDFDGRTAFYEASRPEVSSLDRNWFTSYSNVHAKSFKEVVVQSVELDSLFDFIDILKIDTEGSEYRVLCGARELIESGRIKYILLERQENQRRILHTLTNYYDMFVINKSLRRFVENEIDSTSLKDMMREPNLLLVRKCRN